MKISFQTKEESNRLRQEAFLKLSGAERVQAFLSLCEHMKNFPTKQKPQPKNNFEIVLNRDSALEK